MGFSTRSWLLLATLASTELYGAAPAPFREQASAGSYLRVEEARVAIVANRLATAGSRFCPERFPLTGLLFHHLPEYAPAQRAQVIAAHSLERGPGVLSVLGGSPGAEAGLRAGDVLLSVNGRRLPSGASQAAEADPRVWRKAVEGSEALLERELQSGPVRLSVLRAGRPIEMVLGSRRGCPSRIRLARSPQVNGFISGRYVILTTGLLGFVRNDDELAIITAHEMAHLILRHTERLEAQKVPKGTARGWGRNASLVRATEEEADRLGLKLAWAAGYDVSAAVPFWRRFYEKFEGGPTLFRTHPSLRAREKLITETLAEISASASNPRAQRPELREGALRQR